MELEWHMNVIFGDTNAVTALVTKQEDGIKTPFWVVILKLTSKAGYSAWELPYKEGFNMLSLVGKGKEIPLDNSVAMSSLTSVIKYVESLGCYEVK